MYFCPKCNYSFDISKSTNTVDDRKILDNPIDVLKRLKAKKNFANYKASFPKNELTDHKIYKKLSQHDKDTMEVIFNDNKSFGGIEFKCMNCNYRKPINETIRLYQMNVKSQYNIFHTIEDNKLLAMNPIYPRTKDYTCKNVNCITHKLTGDDIEKKEAVFYREKDSYETNYLCTVCFNSWNV
jgi:hypothetical protein